MSYYFDSKADCVAFGERMKALKGLPYTVTQDEEGEWFVTIFYY